METLRTCRTRRISVTDVLLRKNVVSMMMELGFLYLAEDVPYHWPQFAKVGSVSDGFPTEKRA